MGLFDKLFSTAKTAETYTPTNEQAAWVAIVYAAASIDGEVTDVERDTFCERLLFKAMFKGHDIIDYFREVMTALHRFNPKQIIDGSVSSISEDYKDTLFCIVTETLLSDNIIEETEQEILEYLATALGLQEQVATKIIEVMMIKTKGNIKIYV